MFQFFPSSVFGDVKVQSSLVFLRWHLYHMTDDVILSVLNSHRRSSTYGQNSVSIGPTVAKKKEISLLIESSVLLVEL